MTYLILLGISSIEALGQNIITYDEDNPTAEIFYSSFLENIYKSVYAQLPKYPIKGAYSPTAYSDRSLEIPQGVGVCNYIYFRTDGRLEPGKQYRLRLTIKFGEAYAQMQYFQKNFGVALLSDLGENHFGLRRTQFIPFNAPPEEEVSTVEIIFRPLCVSRYLVLGVFEGQTNEHQKCFACQYGFELYDLVVVPEENLNIKCQYICNAFERTTSNTDFRLSKKLEIAATRFCPI